MSDEPTTPDQESSDDAWLLPHLAGLPAPVMPPEIADRLRSVIRAEAQLRAGTPDPASPPVPGVADLDAERSARRSSRRWWSAAAAVAAVGVAGLVYVETMPTDANGGGTVAAESSAAATFAQAAIVPITSGVDYSVQNIPTMVPAAITSARIAAPTEALRTTFAETEAGIRSCLAGVGEPPQDLALLDLARFQDAPVAVLAYLDGNDDGTADVVVVGVRCSRDDPQVRHRDVANMIPAGLAQPE